MIGRIAGVILHRAMDHVLIDVRGVGYIVHVSNRTAAALPPVGEACALYTDLLVREDLLQLFGFPTMLEKEWHKLLMTVQGVGAKASLAILGALGAAGLAACTVPGDCAWEPNDTCPEGAQCFPTSARGESVCLPYGLLRAGAACAGPGCGAGLTCAPAAGDAGVCRPVCVPRDSSPCARGQCRPIEGLPNNYGACDG